MALSNTAAKSLTVFLGVDVGEGVAGNEIEEADAAAEEEEDPDGEAGGGGDPLSAPTPIAVKLRGGD